MWKCLVPESHAWRGEKKWMRQQSFDNTSGETYFYFLKHYRNWQEYKYFLKWSNLGHFALV